MRQHIETYYPKIRHIFRVWLPFLEPDAWLVPAVARFVRELFFEPLRGAPLGLIVASPRATLGQNFLTLCKKSGANLIQKEKIPGQQITPTTPSTKQVRFQTNNDNQSKQSMFYFYRFTKPRKSEAPSFKTMGSAELPMG